MLAADQDVIVTGPLVARYAARAIQLAGAGEGMGVPRLITASTFQQAAGGLGAGI